MKTKECKHCLKNLPVDQFYKKSKGYWSYCKPCESLRKKQQLVNFKRQCLEYKNQFTCIKCGYGKCITALDFHHRDSDEKDFAISQCNNLRLNQKIKNELDKCDVLCSNCHREYHALEEGVFTPKQLKPRTRPLCKICGLECSYGYNKCRTCYNKEQAKNIPSKNQLILDIESIKYATRIGEKYGVTGNAVKKWFQKYDLMETYKSR